MFKRNKGKWLTAGLAALLAAIAAAPPDRLRVALHVLFENAPPLVEPLPVK